MTVEFDPFSRDFFDDPYATYARLRDEAPCYHSERYDFYALSRYEDVVAAHRDHDTFISSRGLTYEQLSDPDADVPASIITMDPPDHTRYRKLVSRAFTPRAMASWEDLVRGIVSGYLEPLVGEPSFDLVGEFAGPFPVEVISAILGVPEGDRQQIRHWTDTMLRREEGEAASGVSPTVAAARPALRSARSRHAPRAAPPPRRRESPRPCTSSNWWPRSGGARATTC